MSLNFQKCLFPQVRATRSGVLREPRGGSAGDPGPVAARSRPTGDLDRKQQPSFVGNSGHPTGPPKVDPLGRSAQAVHPAVPGLRQANRPPGD